MSGQVLALQLAQKPPPVVRPAEPADLLAEWPFIRRGLQKIKHRLGRHSYWLPESIRAAVVGGRASLFLVERGTQLVGFLVTTVQTDPFMNIPLSLFIWVAYSVDGGVAEGHKYLERYARDNGLLYLEALTARPGLVRRMERHGWERAMFVLRKDVQEGD